MKADLDKMNHFYQEFKAQTNEFKHEIDRLVGNQLTLEHYAERYVPIQVQGMIIENLKLLHNN